MKRKLGDFGDLWPAEAKLAAEVHTGLTVFISDSVPPEDAPRDLRIRASFIRYLALGGCEECHPSEKGVRMLGAYIEGDGDPRAETPGLDLEGCTLHGDLALLRCRIPDTVLLRSASLRSFYLNYSELFAGLEADGLSAKGSVVLRGVSSTGEIRLPGADLSGDLDGLGARLAASNSGTAFNADRLRINGNAILRRLNSTGEVRFMGAVLDGVLDFSMARLTAGKSGYALVADRLTAKGDVFLCGMSSTGELRFGGADISGVLDCTSTTVKAEKDGKAINADRLRTKGGVLLRGVKGTGEIRLLGAELGGSLDCAGATMIAGESGFAIIADGLSAKGAFFLRKEASIQGFASLAGATVGTLNDDPNCWPIRKGDLDLNGFRYERVDGHAAPVNAQDRLAWLSLQEGRTRRSAILHARMALREGGHQQAEALVDRALADSDFDLPDEFEPQPYEHLAKVFREMGHVEDARAVLIEKERLQRADRRRRVRAVAKYAELRTDWFWDRFVGVTVAYGHRPLQALWFLAGIWLLGVMIFSAAYDRQAIKPNDAFSLRSPDWVLCATPETDTVTLSGGTQPVQGRAAPGQSQYDCFASKQAALGYPTFNAFIYSLDTLLPVVSLEMQQYWIPDERMPIGWWARVYLWVHIGLGWGLSLLAVAGFSGLVKSD